MRHALSHHFMCDENEWEFIERLDSTPEIGNLPDNIYISLTHSNGLICFAISNFPVGVDIEATNKQRDCLALAKTIMNDGEFDYFIQNTTTQTDLFYRIWCAKEAYYKALPPSEQAVTSLDQISFPTLLENKENWPLLEGKMGYLILAVAIKNYPEKIDCNYYLTKNSPAGVIWN